MISLITKSKTTKPYVFPNGDTWSEKYMIGEKKTKNKTILNLIKPVRGVIKQ